MSTLNIRAYDWKIVQGVLGKILFEWIASLKKRISIFYNMHDKIYKNGIYLNRFKLW